MMTDFLTTSILASSITWSSFLICMGVSLLLGMCITLAYMYGNQYTQSFACTLLPLPAIVQVVIMLVNGNIGTGLAVAGTFGLVRFRSVAGTAREIGSIFLAMAVGLATGMGYLGTAALFTLAICAVQMLLTFFWFGKTKRMVRELSVVIPENLDYTGLFDDIFSAIPAGMS